MTESELYNTPESKDSNSITTTNWAPIRVGRLAAKELRETLRDRRTIATLFLMPLLVYPILSLLFQGFFASRLQQPATEPEPEKYSFVFESADELETVATPLRGAYVLMQRIDRDLERRLAGQESQPADNSQFNDISDDHVIQTLNPELGLTLHEVVQGSEADLGVKVHLSQDRRRVPRFSLIYRDDSARSVEALRMFQRLLSLLNINSLRQQLAARRLPRGQLILHDEQAVESRKSTGAPISFAALIPLILTLMTITGAVYPAIDLTAGERERGTLESMIAAPIPRMRILLGKLVAVVAVAMLTAVLNLVGMTITIWVFRLDTVLFGEQGLTWVPVLQILGLLVLFAGFFASVLLVITSFARSFKEGQAYLIPVMLVALAPSLLSLNPDLELNSLWAITPLVNIVLLSRDVLQSNAQWSTAIVTIAATVFYAALAITIAARFFGTATVLYGDSQGISTLFRRPKEKRATASASLAMLCLALLFPASFIGQGILARTADAQPTTTNQSMEQDPQPVEQETEQEREIRLVRKQSIYAASILFVVFFAVPLFLTRFHRIRFFSGFRVRRTSLLCFAAAILLGVGVAPLLMQAIASSGHWIELINASENRSNSELLKQAESHASRLRLLPIWWVLLCFAVVPAVFEELFFRGLLFQSLRLTLSPWQTILATALMFGAFHLITTGGLGISRLVPTTFMGIILGWVCYRSGSVLPGMFLHAIHNALALSLSYYRDELVSLQWISIDQENVPPALLLGGLVCSVLGIIILWRRKRNVD